MAGTHHIVLIHGIRTRADWQTMVQNELEKIDGVTVFPTGYGYFNLFWFLGPQVSRHRPINELRPIINQAYEKAMEAGAKFSVIAHSNGTHAIVKLLDEGNVKLDTLVLCGSILPAKFRWDRLTASKIVLRRIINDYGARDVMPVLARWVTFGYGDSGTYGFNDGRINRAHDRGHSDFFDKSFVVKYWRPLFETPEIEPVKGSVDKNGNRPRQPAWFWLLNGHIMYWVASLLTIVALLWYTGNLPFEWGRQKAPTTLQVPMKNNKNHTKDKSSESIENHENSDKMKFPDPKDLNLKISSASYIDQRGQTRPLIFYKGSNRFVFQGVDDPSNPRQGVPDNAIPLVLESNNYSNHGRNVVEVRFVVENVSDYSVTLSKFDIKYVGFFAYAGDGISSKFGISLPETKTGEIDILDLIMNDCRSKIRVDKLSVPFRSPVLIPGNGMSFLSIKIFANNRKNEFMGFECIDGVPNNEVSGEFIVDFSIVNSDELSYSVGKINFPTTDLYR
jgi:hypothetical protein